MLDEGGGLKLKTSWGIDGRFARQLMYRDGVDLPSYCHSTGEAVILNDLKIHEQSGMRVNSIICVPIKTSTRAHGILLIVNKSRGGQFGDDDRERLEMLLNFVAVAIDNSRLMQEQLRQQKIEQEIAIARQVQETILPQNLDAVPGAEIGVVYYPAREVGGDFYDLYQLTETQWLVVLGDVSNKGIPAALVMSAAAGIIKSILAMDKDIAVNDLAARVNGILAHDIIRDREMFITLFFARFDLSDMSVTYCNAGHLPGLFWDSRTSEVTELSKGGPIVGQFDDIRFTIGTRSIAPGDRLFLFTDGLTEAEDAQGKLFGRERVEQVFTSEADLDPKAFCARVRDWADQFSQGAPEDSRDDFTIMQIRIK
jgi:sigma-B regulation protein RsbU (phosphoserine phosphatase)